MARRLLRAGLRRRRSIALRPYSYYESNYDYDYEGSYEHSLSTAINFSGAELAHADLRGSELIAKNSYGDASIDFSGANLAHADLSGSELIATTSDGEATIDFTDTMNADLRDSDYWSGPGFIALTAVL